MLPLHVRLEQLRVRLARNKSPTCPVILGGDFNTSGASDTLVVHRPVRMAGLRGAPDGGAPAIRDGRIFLLAQPMAEG